MNHFDSLGKQINSKINMHSFFGIPDIESECYMQILFIEVLRALSKWYNQCH